jgi:hypothetical protein
MTKHRHDLLLEINRDPASDAPRQVLADHYEQEGELDRASLIQLQIRRASLPWWDAQVPALELQERAILAKREAEWRAALPKLEGVQWGTFSRGFVGKVAFDSVDAYQKHLKKVIEAAPIQSIVLHWPRAKAPKLAALEQLRELTFVGTVMRPEDLKWLAGCPLLSTVRSLDLIDSALRTGLPHLLKSPHLGNLEALRIPLSHVGNSGVAKLLEANLPKLGELELSVGVDEEYGGGSGAYEGVRRASPITSKGMLEIAANANLARVHSLDLSGATLGSEGLLMLLASIHTKGLRTLRIRKIKDGDWDMDDSMTAFKSGPFGTLDELDISNNDLDPEGAHFMAESKALRELKVLRIDNVKSNSFDRLGKATWIRSLRVLSCSGPALPSLLTRVPEQLHTLQIGPSSALISKVIAHLAASPPPVLRVLDLRSARIDDHCLRKLGETKLPGLTTLVLPRRPHQEFSLATLTAFAISPLGAKLTSLDADVPEVDRLPAPARVSIGDGDYSGSRRYL